MFANILLKNSIKNLAIPVKWINKINLIDLMNNSINLSQTYIVFYCKRKREPDFTLPVKITFCDEEDFAACYEAHILKFFGKRK